jgi:hypothetical protein
MQQIDMHYKNVLIQISASKMGCNMSHLKLDKNRILSVSVNLIQTQMDN